jgi:hypothetical protein
MAAAAAPATAASSSDGRHGDGEERLKAISHRHSRRCRQHGGSGSTRRRLAGSGDLRGGTERVRAAAVGRRVAAWRAHSGAVMWRKRLDDLTGEDDGFG